MLTILALLLLGQFTGINVRTISPPTSPVHYANNGCSSAPTGLGHISCTVTVAASGSTILFYTSEFNMAAGSPPTATDSLGGTVTHLLGPTTFNGGTGTDDVWLIPNAVAGAHLITVTYHIGESFETLVVNVYTGASTTSPVHNAVAGQVTLASPASCPTLTADSSDLLVSFESNSNITMSPGILPQRMTLSQVNGASLTVYGTARFGGSNFVEWLMTGATGNTFACDTIALH
jgi:hypothetical protein